MTRFPPLPVSGRMFRTRYRIRLSDTDATGRLRLDAIARFLQDAATDDVAETGWGAPEHLWVIRRVQLEIVEPLLADGEVEITTWSSGSAALAAARRWSLIGDRGGRVEVDSVWIHLGPDARPARIDDFGVYLPSTAGRRISTRLVLPDPPDNGIRLRWPLRVTDADVLGHVNNAAYWEAIEQVLVDGGPDLRRPLTAELDYRHPLDLADHVELVVLPTATTLDVGFAAAGQIRAVARLEGTSRSG